MIPDIGVMIAAYIVTRMAALIGQPSADANSVAKVLAILSIIVTVICTADLLARGVNISPP